MQIVFLGLISVNWMHAYQIHCLNSVNDSKLMQLSVYNNGTLTSYLLIWIMAIS